MTQDHTGGSPRVVVHGLAVEPVFYRFIDAELLPAIAMPADDFWSGTAAIVRDLTPVNRALLEHRQSLQSQIDDWHREHPGRDFDRAEYQAFLTRIGYLREPGEPFRIDTANVDREIAEVAGPQLVVPVNNARFAINAANARWGSLYDALYGTDVIPRDGTLVPGEGYNAVRGAAVIDYASGFLDRSLPLDGAAHAEVDRYFVDTSGGRTRFAAILVGGQQTGLRRPEQFKGFAEKASVRTYLFAHHGLHIELRTDPGHAVGATAAGHLADVVLEAAVTTIQDCEDSVAAVDAEDKVGVYRNWLGLMQGTLEAAFTKAGRPLTRTLAADRRYTGVDGAELVLPGRSLMLVRNVGHLTTNSAVLDADGKAVFEGILDAIVTSGGALANRRQTGRLPNGRYGSIYIVKPKMHGPDEVGYTDTLFARVERMYGLEPFTLKVGVMDEERRTSVNLHECIHRVKQRLVFINTGFLDRTGDEIHTSMHAAPVLPKEAIKREPWIAAYEDWNVDIGIRCGLPGRAQIGKGMWPKPDEMAQMMQTKQAHPEAGANCAWVPSPTAATLHAMHYHAVDVRARQRALAQRRLASLDDLLTPPLVRLADQPAADTGRLDAETIQAELKNNAQGILGYVVRWIDRGIGCSKVPDIDNVGLMEDRATLRISSQHLANWLLHGVTDEAQVMATLRRMAAVVDEQNAADPDYRRMSDDFDRSRAFQAACDLVFKGVDQPNGYTEPLLQAHRLARKADLRGL